MIKLNEKRRERAIVLFFAALAVLLAFLPTGFAKQLYRNAEGVRARVVGVDDSRLYYTGIITQGEQWADVEILSGSHRGETVRGFNLMQGSVERDKIFREGDAAYAILERDDDGRILLATLVDHDRIPAELLLAGVFVVLLIVFSGWKGIRTVIGFVVTFLLIWKVLVPGMLKGYPPLLLALIIGNAITLVILLLVTGWSKIAFAAISASAVSSLFTGAMAILFSSVFRLNGTVMIDAESLLHAGFQHLNLTAIMQAGMYLACSGAVMDMSVDIAAALEEIVDKAPHVSRGELVRSGLRIGRAVVGTQTTTLILAYIGNYLSILMVYMAQGTGSRSIFSSRHIAAEILAALVGCCGIVLVSPLTSLIGAYVMKRDNRVVSAGASGRDGAGQPDLPGEAPPAGGPAAAFFASIKAKAALAAELKRTAGPETPSGGQCEH